MAGLTQRQRDALKRNSPTPADILENPGYVQELNQEIASSYSQKIAAEFAAADPGLVDATPFTPEEETPMSDEFVVPDVDVEAELDKQLAKINSQLEKERKARESAEVVADKTKAPEKTQEEIIREQILEMLRKSKGAPNEVGIAQLKQKYGENGVHVVALGEGDVYIFTHLRRGQWKKIQEVSAKMAQSQDLGSKAEDNLKESVLKHCVLWPKVDALEFLYNSRAGVIDTLFELIMLNSYFLTPQQSLQLTVSL